MDKPKPHSNPSCSRSCSCSLLCALNPYPPHPLPWLSAKSAIVTQAEQMSIVCALPSSSAGWGRRRGTKPEHIQQIACQQLALGIIPSGRGPMPIYAGLPMTKTR